MAKKATKSPKPGAASVPASDPNAIPAWMIWTPPVLAFLLYCMGLRNEMLGIDDHSATVDNPAVTQFAPFTSFNLGMYAPLTWLGYAVAYLLGGNNPILYHLLSLAAHTVNTYLVFRLVGRLVRPEDGAENRLSMTPFWVALLFAIHPIQVESVAWIAGFSTPLYTLFNLMALLWYLDYAEQPINKQAYRLALLAFVLACLSKSAAVTLPLVLMAVDWWAGRSPFDRKRLMGYAPFFLAAAFFGALTIYSRVQSNMNLDSNDNVVTLLDRFLVVCYTPVLYWTKYLLPLKLNIYYSFERVNGQFPWAYWAAPLVLAGVLFAGWRYRKQAPYLWFGLLFFFANLSVMLPFKSMGTFELCADHYNYLAAVGIFFLLVQGVAALGKRFTKLSGALNGLSLLWIAALCVLSFRQVHIWKDTITVISNAIDNGFSQNGRLYEGRANAKAKLLGKNRGKPGYDPMDDRRIVSEAINDYSRAIAINPELWDSYKFRGGLYGMMKMYERSAEDLGKYVEKYPENHEQMFNLGLSLYNLGHHQEAIKAFDRTLQLDPDFVQAYAARGNAYTALGDSVHANLDLQEYDIRKTTPKEK